MSRTRQRWEEELSIKRTTPNPRDQDLSPRVRRDVGFAEKKGILKALVPIRIKLSYGIKIMASRGETSSGKGNLAEAIGLYVPEALSSTYVHLEDEWIMDTGCSYHMTHKREYFEDLIEDAGGWVRMGNKTMSKVKGVGTIRVKNVRYIPKMDINLLSLGTLEKAGYKFELENRVLSIKAGEHVLLTERRYDTLYAMEISYKRISCTREKTRWYSSVGIEDWGIWVRKIWISC